MARLLKSVLAALALSFAVQGCGTQPTLPGAQALVGQDGPKGFQYRTLTRGLRVRKYGLFIPVSYRPSKKYPVIVYLHGIGESQGVGEGDGKNLNVGLGPSVAFQKDTFPFIVIFPQCDGKWDPNSPYAEDVIAALDDVSKTYSVDQDRVTLTGTSIGGYGAYAIGARYHDRFAAIVPLCSNQMDLADVPALTKVPIRAYVSSSGDMFAGTHDLEMVEAIAANGGKAEFITTPTVGHNCWDYVYSRPELFAWIAQQRRRPTVDGNTAIVRKPPQAPIAPAERSPIATPVRPAANLIFPGTSY
jgi:predicted peptidase